MTLQEADKIIAEFMGLYPLDCGKFYSKKPPSDKGRYIFHLRYTESLDALVPVWDELRSHDFKITPSMFCNPLGYYEFEVTPSTEEGDKDRWTHIYGNSLIPSQAAAIATAKAIKELEK